MNSLQFNRVLQTKTARLLSKACLLIVTTIMAILSFGQETTYFNTIYNPMANFARGRGIIELDNEYYCLTNTDDPSNTYQSFLFMKLDQYGVVINQKLFHLPGQALYPGDVGGTLKKTNDNNFVFAYHASGSGMTYSSLVKFNQDLDTMWKMNYMAEYQTVTVNCYQLSDNGFILTGWVWADGQDYSDLLLLKTDSLGNYQWHKVYGSAWVEKGQNVIQTPDGGYLIGGYFWKPGLDHSLDAMVVKTDSLGNEQWAKYYGNPDVDDDMAFVALADDGNYLVATVYGEYIWTPEARAGRVLISKIDQSGEIIWENKIGETRYGYYIKNFKQTEDSNYILNGWSEVIDSTIPFVYYPGWILKLNQIGDSLWFRDYDHFNGLYAKNYIYDLTPTTDNGYIAIGQSNEAFTQTNMWVIKVDSMGCDTPGCATGVFVEEFSWHEQDWGEGFSIYPNPAKDYLVVELLSGNIAGAEVTIFDMHGKKVREFEIPARKQQEVSSLKGIKPGIYLIKLENKENGMATKKFTIGL